MHSMYLVYGGLNSDHKMKKITLIEINGVMSPTEPIPQPNFGVFTEIGFINVCETTEEAAEFMPVVTLTLDEVKSLKKDQIDQKTQELIFKGFEFEGHRWSLSEYAQINWSNIPNADYSEFPMTMMDMDCKLYILTLDKRMDFYNKVFSIVKSIRIAGSTYVYQMMQLTTKDDVLNFVDPR